MLIVTAAATDEPVTLAEAKAHLRVTHNSDDTLIGALITAAREAAEQITGRALAAASYRYAAEGAAETVIRLPLWPVDAVSALTYLDADGVRQTMDAADYTLDGDRATVTIDEMPAYMADVSVTFDVDPALIPDAVLAGIKIGIEELYTSAQPDLSERVLYRYRVNLGV